MLAYRGLLLLAMISSASIVLADVLFQPNRKLQDQKNIKNNRYYSQYQRVPQYPSNGYAAQLAAHNFRMHPIETYARHQYPYRQYQNYLKKYPLIYQPRPKSNYEDPRYSAIFHYRYKRSSDPTIKESKQQTNHTTEYGDVMATESSLIDTSKHPVNIHYLSNNKSIGTSDKPEKKYQIDSANKGLFLFDLSPENMSRENRQSKIRSYEPRDFDPKTFSTNTINRSDDQLTINSAKSIITQPTQTMSTSQEEQEEEDPRCNYKNLKSANNMLPDSKKLSEDPIATSTNKNSAPFVSRDEYYNDNQYKNTLPSLLMPLPESYVATGHRWNRPNFHYSTYDPERRNIPNPRLIYPPHSSKSMPNQQDVQLTSIRKPQKSRNGYHEEELILDRTVDTPDFDQIADPYRMQPAYFNTNQPPEEIYPFPYGDYNPFPYEDYIPDPADLGSAFHKNRDIQSNLALRNVLTSPCVLSRFPTYNYPIMRYVVTPQRYYISSVPTTENT